jgi:hypothetical protein
VYVAVYKVYKGVESTKPVSAFVLGVYSNPQKAVDAFESIFDDDPQFFIGVGMVEFVEFSVEIEKTAWAVERGWRKVEGSVIRAITDKVYRPLTKAEQGREDEALAEEYGRAVAEYESETNE